MEMGELCDVCCEFCVHYSLWVSTGKRWGPWGVTGGLCIASSFGSWEFSCSLSLQWSLFRVNIHFLRGMVS